MTCPIVIKRYGRDFIGREEAGEHAALILPATAVAILPETANENNVEIDHNKTYVRYNLDGWIISGKLHTDWFIWVNDFNAFNPEYGHVWGNFENEVYASSEEAFQHFYENHPPKAWDYWDI